MEVLPEVEENQNGVMVLKNFDGLSLDEKGEQSLFWVLITSLTSGTMTTVNSHDMYPKFVVDDVIELIQDRATYDQLRYYVQRSKKDFDFQETGVNDGKGENKEKGEG